MNPEFWAGKRVFLTGHTGFKGGWLSLWLEQLGADVTGYALAPCTVPSFYEVAKVERGLGSVIADIRDLGAVRKAIEDSAPEIVIHMAAQPLVRDSYQHPVETFGTNVMGTVHLLEAVREARGVRAVVNVTSDKCYENRAWPWGYRETDALGGADPYSNSKACTELVTSAYRDSFFGAARGAAAIATARAGNVIGGGDWAADRLIPDAIQAFEAGRPLRIRNPAAVRPWQHVLEPLRGYLALAERLYEDGSAFAEAWNFGPGDEEPRSVAWIADRVAALWGSGACWQPDEREHPHEASFLRLDISKARSRLDWRPVLDLQEALELTVDWARARLGGADMREHSLSQIARYQAAAVG